MPKYIDSKLLERVATYQTAYDFSRVLGLLPDPDPVLRKRGAGLAVYRDLLVDAHTFACVQSRKSGTLGLPWRLEPGDETPAGKRAAAFVEANFKKLDMKRITGETLDAPFWGYVPFEYYWRADGPNLVLADVVGLPPEWFAFTPDGELRFLTVSAPIDGEPVPENKFALVRHYPSYDNPYGERILSRCFWPTVFKKGGLKFWFIFTEKFGMPHVIGKHPRGASETEIATLFAALDKAVQDAVLVITDDEEVDFKEATGRAASATVYNLLKDACNAEISKAVLGQTLTTEIGNVGSLAASNTHFDIRQDLIDADRSITEDFWNGVAAALTRMNFGDAAAAPRFFLVVKEDVSVSVEMAQRDETLWKMGVPLATEDLYRRHQIPVPAQSEPTLPPPPTGAGGSAFAEKPPATAWPLATLDDDARTKAEAAYAPLVAARADEISAWKNYDAAAALGSAPGKTTALVDYLHGLIATGYLYGRAAGVAQEHRALDQKAAAAFADEPPPEIFTPEAALTYFRNKVPMSPEEFARLDAAARAKAFTIAGVDDDRLLAAIKQEVERAIAEGRPFGEFKANVDAVFDRAGVGRKANYRIAQIYGDNLASAYGAGLYDELHSPVAETLFPYYRYRDAGDRSVRPAHRLNGTIVRRNDPWAAAHWGPWEYGCRCWMEGVTAEEAKGTSISKGDKLPGPTASGFTNPAQGYLDISGAGA